MRCVLLLAAVFLLVPCAAAADEEPASAAAAQALIDAWDRGDQALVGRLASKWKPDPWIVAFRLCAAGRHEVASAIPEAENYPDFTALRGQIAKWKQVRVDADVLARWDEVEVAYAKKAWRDVLFASAEIDLRRTPFLGAVKAVYRGIATFQRKSYAAAVPMLTQAAERAEFTGWLQGVSAALWKCGHAQQRTGAYEDAVESWTRCAAVYDRRRLPYAAALTRGNLGALLYNLPDYRGAVRQMSDALVVLREAKQPAQVARTLRNIAWAREGLGEYADALRDAREARRISAGLKDQVGVADTDLGIATLLARVGDHAEAERRAKLAIEGYAALSGAARDDGLARAYGTMGLVWLSADEYRKAAAAYEKARELAAAAGDERTAMKAFTGVATAEGMAGDWDVSIKKLKEVLVWQREAKDATSVNDALYWLGEFHRQAGRLKEASAYFNEALDGARRIDRAGQIIDCRLGLTKLDFAAKRYAKAMRSARAAIKVMNRTVRGLGQERGAMARAPRAELVELGIQSAAAVRDAVNFSYFVEVGRAGALLEALGAREPIRRAAIPEGLRAREEAARLRVAAARVRLQRAGASQDLKAIRKSRKELEQAQRALDEALDDMRRVAPAGADLLYQEPAPLRDIRRSLEPYDALVQYAFAGDRLYALYATREFARVIPLGSTTEIDALAAGVSASLQDPSPDPKNAKLATQRLLSLHGVLVKPLGVQAHIRRLLVMPDSKLQLVPLRVLAARLESVYIPSGTSVLRLRKEERVPAQGVLALGDPAYPKNARRRPHDGRRAGSLSRLPATRTEVKAVGTKVFVDKQATESALRKALTEKKGRWRALHLACHGGVDPKRPMRSWLALTPEAPDDGYLTGLDVLRLEIDADLAVLSACESGSGTVFPVEGLVGLTRAFLLAGAPRMLVSLWKVDDEATLALMKKFYELWNPTKPGVKRLTASAALLQAQDYMRKQKKWEHPYYWAAWVLWGLPD